MKNGKERNEDKLTWSADVAGGDEDDGDVNVGFCVSCLRFPFASPVFLFWTSSFAFNFARRPGYWDGRDEDDDEMLSPRFVFHLLAPRLCDSSFGFSTVFSSVSPWFFRVWA